MGKITDPLLVLRTLEFNAQTAASRTEAKQAGERVPAPALADSDHDRASLGLATTPTLC
jgi:hypothetical protein